MGRVKPELIEPTDCREICAKCRQAFPDLRAWSRHAFKRHGRVNPARRLATGTQCSVCLTHYKTNRALCAHISYSRRCRAALVNANVEYVPEPGIGSRKFDDGKHALLPAYPAQGPKAVWNHGDFLDEWEQPEERILCSLVACFCNDGEYGSYQALLQAVKGFFSNHCLQLTRLRATASCWKTTLEEALLSEEDFPFLWISWHKRIISRAPG